MINRLTCAFALTALIAAGAAAQPVDQEKAEQATRRMYERAAQAATRPRPATRPAQASDQKLVDELRAAVAALQQENEALKAELAQLRQPTASNPATQSSPAPLPRLGEETLAPPADPEDDGRGQYVVTFVGTDGAMHDQTFDASSYKDAVQKVVRMRPDVRPRFDEQGRAHYDGIRKVRSDRDGRNTKEDGRPKLR